MTQILPNLLIIGAQISATRWLRIKLGEHPDVYMAPRELEFFNKHYERGPWWYAKQFRAWIGQPHVGEATPGYMMWAETPSDMAARIDGLLPDVRLIALLRDPVDRARSAFVHHQERDRIPRSAKLMDYVRQCPPERDPLAIVSGGWYGRSLEPYVERFGSRLCVLVDDDVREPPAALYARACRHLGIDDTLAPRDPGQAPFRNQPHDHEARLSEAEREELSAYFVEDLRLLAEVTSIDPQVLIRSETSI